MEKELHGYELPNWLADLQRDLLEPYRGLAVRQEFYVQMQNGKLPRKLLERYIMDTLWAVKDFADIAREMSHRAPAKHKHFMESIAQEEENHPRMLARVLTALGLDPSGIIRGDGNYRPTPMYELWWTNIQYCTMYLPWEYGIAALMVGVEDLARVQENIVGNALIEHYGLTEPQAAWFRHHGGEEEEEHGELGLVILGNAIDQDDTAAHAKVRELIELAAGPLLFHYPNGLLGRQNMDYDEKDSVQSAASKHLAELGVNYGTVPHPEGVRTAREFADAAGIPEDRIFKTMVLKKSNDEHFLYICPSTERINFEFLEKHVGTKPELANRDDVTDVTGYQPNSVSPFGVKQQLATYAASTLFHGSEVYLGSGEPGVDIKVKSLDVLERLKPKCL